MATLRHILVALVFAFSLFSEPTQAAETKTLPIGFRTAMSMDRSKHYFEQYEIFMLHYLPWKTKFKNNWYMNTKMDIGVAVIDGQGETSGKGSAAVDIFFYPPDSGLSFDTSVGLGLMSDHTHGEVDFGGPIFVRFHTGVNYQFDSGLSVGYKFYHESNGRIYTKNPSLNMHQFELKMHF